MTQPIIAWSSTLLYPAGAFSWSGTPTKVAPAVTYLTPNQPQGLSAQNLNWLLNQSDAILAQVAIGQWAGAAANWNPPLTDVGIPSIPIATPYCACWDAYYEQWIVAGLAGGSAFLTCSYDGGKSYFPIAGALPTPTVRSAAFAVATNPVNGDLCLFRTDATNCSVTRWSGGTGTPTDTVQAALAGADTGVLAYFNSSFWFVGSSGFTTPNWTGFSAQSASGVGAWTNESGTLPVGWASSVSNAQLQYIAAQSPTTLAVAMCGATPGTSTSRLMSMTTSSPAWADITPAILGGTAQEIRGLCYEANDALWGLLTQDNSSNSYLYTSPDLATWTLVQTFTGFWSCGVATIGAVFAVLLYDAAAAEGGNRIAYSSTVPTLQAGSTWSFAAYAEAISGESTELPANPAGLLLSNAGAQLGTIAGGGVLGAPNLVGTQLFRCEIFRATAGGTCASSNIAGYSGAVPTATIAGGSTPTPTPTPTIPSNLGPKSNQTLANGNNDNKAWGGLGVIRIDITGPTASCALRGITGGTDGQVLELWFNYNQQTTLSNLSSGSLAGSRFQTPTGVDTVMPAPGAASGNSIPYNYARLVYDSAVDGGNGGWRVS